MKLENIDLGFLWAEKKGAVLDAKHPFDEKWDDEIIKLAEYVKNSSIITFIDLFVNCHKDNFPREYWYGFLVKGIASKYVYQEGEFSVIDGEHFHHKEIARYMEIEKEDEHEFEYVYERIIEFKEPIQLKEIIEENLDGKIYTKTIEGDKTIYKVEESPIDTITLTPKSFGMTINEDYYIHRFL